MPSQLAPFNDGQFIKCMTWLLKHQGGPVTQFDMVKLHVLADFYHVIACGRPIIGGNLEKWPLGPVVKRAYDRARYWAYLSDEGKPGSPFDIRLADGRAYEYSAPLDSNVDERSMSQSEKDALLRAWKVLMVDCPDFNDRHAYFHDPARSFVARAYDKSREHLDWADLIAEYDQEFGEDHADVLAAIVQRNE